MVNGYNNKMEAQRKAHVDEEATAGSLSICWKQQVKSVLSPALRRIEKERETETNSLRTRHCWSLKVENGGEPSEKKVFG